MWISWPPKFHIKFRNTDPPLFRNIPEKNSFFTASLNLYSDMSDQILYRHMCYIWLLIKQQDDCTPCWLQNYIPRSRTSKKPSIRPATRPYSGSMIHWIMMNNHSLPSRSRGNILNHFEIIEWIFPCHLCTSVNVERGTIFKQHFVDSLPPVTCKHCWSKNQKYRPYQSRVMWRVIPL